MSDSGKMNALSGSFLENMMNAGFSGSDEDDLLQMPVEELSSYGHQAQEQRKLPQAMGQEQAASRVPVKKPAVKQPQRMAPPPAPARKDPEQISPFRIKEAKIKVIGVGGAGCNALEKMIGKAPDNIEFIAVNTDTQALELSHASKKLVLGEKLTKGRGAGSNPEIGAKAAEQSIEELKKCVEGADIVFIAAGMGRGTGTGAAPIIADLAKKAGCLTIAVVTKPFEFEGAARMAVAKEGIFNLSSSVDTIITVSNQLLLPICASNNMTFLAAFGKVDDILCSGVLGIADILRGTGIINVDFADVYSVLSNGGASQVGIGEARGGEGRAVMAAQNAMFGPLLETTIDGAKSILFNITSNSSISMKEIEQASNQITSAAAPNAKIVMGMVTDDTIEDDTVTITLLATGLRTDEDKQREEQDDSSNFSGFSDFSSPSYSSSSSFGVQEQEPQPATIRRQVSSVAQTSSPAASSPSSSFDGDDDLPMFVKRRKMKK